MERTSSECYVLLIHMLLMRPVCVSRRRGSELVYNDNHLMKYTVVQGTSTN